MYLAPYAGDLPDTRNRGYRDLLLKFLESDESKMEVVFDPKYNAHTVRTAFAYIKKNDPAFASITVTKRGARVFLARNIPH